MSKNDTSFWLFLYFVLDCKQFLSAEYVIQACIGLTDYHSKNKAYPDSKVHGANMGPIWGRQDPGGPHVGPMNFATWVIFAKIVTSLWIFRNLTPSNTFVMYLTTIITSEIRILRSHFVRLWYETNVCAVRFTMVLQFNLFGCSLVYIWIKCSLGPSVGVWGPATFLYLKCFMCNHKYFPVGIIASHPQAG